MTPPAHARSTRGGLFAFPPSAPYDVSRAKIAEFADAIGDPDPLYRDTEAARAAGHPDVIAPPTFAVAVRAAEFRRRIFTGEPDGLGIDPALVLHVDETYTHTRPLHAGDRVTVQVTVESARHVRDDEILVVRSDIRALPEPRRAYARQGGETSVTAGVRGAHGHQDLPTTSATAVRTTLLVRGGRPGP